ncbi:MAG: hypothetical protein VYC39_11695 [Myxococcota bacterium]|nr:hypothetical protein [Myxococcota bacterium]
MTGNYVSQDLLLTRLMIRAIEHVDLKHEINNASASIGANLAYISLQSTNELKQALEEERTKEVLTEFVEVCDESREALKRVAASLGQPTTDEGEFATDVDLSDCIHRICKCLNNYMPTQKIESSLQAAQVKIRYQDFIFSIVRLLMAFVDVLRSKPDYRSTSLHISIQEDDTRKIKLVVKAALKEGDEKTILSVHDELKIDYSASNFKISSTQHEESFRVIFEF